MEEEEDEESLPQHLAQELEKQKELYDEIMAKTKRLKDLRVVSEVTNSSANHVTYVLYSNTRRRWPRLLSTTLTP